MTQKQKVLHYVWGRESNTQNIALCIKALLRHKTYYTTYKVKESDTHNVAICLKAWFRQTRCYTAYKVKNQTHKVLHYV